MPEHDHGPSVKRGARIEVCAGARHVGRCGIVRRVFTYRVPRIETWVFVVLDGDPPEPAGFLLTEVRPERCRV